MNNLIAEHAQSASEVLLRLGLGNARLNRNQLAELVDGILAEDHLWRPVVKHDQEQRWYARLHHSRNVEVWLIGWETGQDTRFHDHGGSSGAYSVTEGQLYEEFGHVEQWNGVVRRTQTPGRARSFGPDYVHNLANIEHGAATSIHAYSPPLSTMTYYVPEEHQLTPFETIVTEGPEPEIDVAQAARREGYFGAVDDS